MDRTGHHPTPADLQEPAPDRKLHCLCSWLERANQRETHAVHARVLVPVSAMTVGTTLAATLVGVEAHGFAICAITLALAGAIIGFLIPSRRLQIWQAVAARLQMEQRVLIDEDRTKEWSVVGRVPPDRLADQISKKMPVQLFSFGALGLYAGALVLMVLFGLYALSSIDVDHTLKAQTVQHAPIRGADLPAGFPDWSKRPQL